MAIPSYCRADGTIDPHTGADGKPYAIGFAIALPDNWNGRFLFQGGGGLDGAISPPYGSSAAGDAPALARGFAVVAMDSGHRGAVFDAAFMKDQQASLDFAYVALGKVTSVAKQIVAQYYGAAPKYSYFVGCSTGGRQAMLAAERYPIEFDGAVSGDPAQRTANSNAGDAWAAVAFNQAAPKDEAGKPMTGKLFSASDRKLLIDSILNECDVKDGLKDGLIFNPFGCGYDPAVIQCKGPKMDSCLSSDQVRSLKKALSPLKDSRGNEIYPGFIFDTGIADSGRGPNAGGLVPSAVPTGPFGLNLATQFDADQVAARIAADAMQTLTDTYAWTNLSTFSGHGGKLLFYHGGSDPWFSPLDTLSYYKKMAEANGGLVQVQGWSRFYFVPGMLHCGGGSAALDKFDMLTAIVNWVEKGRPPDSITATGKAFPGRSRPLCAYPKHAHYKGQGDPENAGSFECRD